MTLLMSKLSEADDQIDSLTKVLDRMRRRSKEIIRQQPCGK